MLASSGQGHSPLWQRIFWSLSIGAVAIALLLANGLKALQTATIASALPFAAILLIAIWGLFKALSWMLPVAACVIRPFQVLGIPGSTKAAGSAGCAILP